MSVNQRVVKNVKTAFMNRHAIGVYMLTKPDFIKKKIVIVQKININWFLWI